MPSSSYLKVHETQVISLRKLVGNALRRVGFQVISIDLLPHVGLCLHLRRLFATQRIDAVWDVGANRGQYYQFLREAVEFKGTILSFEPVSGLSKILTERSKGDPNWHVFPFALGDQPARLPINIMKASDMSSFLTPDNTQVDRFRDSNTPINTEIVEVKRLDDIYEDFRERYRFGTSYLKLDTQGFDVKVVSGGKAVISNFVALQTEASVLPIYKEIADYRKTILFLNELGFELSGVYPVTTDERLRLIEFDCVMVNAQKIMLVPAEMH